MLEDAVLKYEEHDCEGNVYEGTHRMRRGDGPKLVCRNQLCQGGGFNIINEVDKMLSEKQSEKKIELSCLGVEGNQRSKSRKRSCDRSIEGTLTLVYKQLEAKPKDEHQSE